jgi:FixJ family two-component response regulator
MFVSRCDAARRNPMESHGTAFVIDEDPRQRELVAMAIRAAAIGVETLASAEEFLDRAERGMDAPSCLVLEVRLPGLSGIGLQEKLKHDKFGIPILFLTGFGDIAMAVRAIQMGAVNFIEKPIHAAALLAEISRALDISAQANAEYGHKRAARGRVSQLSTREQSVFELLVEGRSNKEIARRLGIGLPTVTKHRSKVFRKLEVHDIVELVRLAASCS